MGPNDKSRNVCSQILYNYSNEDECDFRSCNLDMSKKIKCSKKIFHIRLK